MSSFLVVCRCTLDKPLVFHGKLMGDHHELEAATGSVSTALKSAMTSTFFAETELALASKQASVT